MDGRVSKLARLIVVLALVVSGVAGASSGFAEEDDKEHNPPGEAEESVDEQAQQDQRETSGTVIEIRPAGTTPPDWAARLILEQVGGPLTVRVVDPDAIARSGVTVGAYVTVYGQAGGTNPGEFDATDIVVGGDDNDNDNDDGDNDNDDGDDNGNDNDDNGNDNDDNGNDNDDNGNGNDNDDNDNGNDNDDNGNGNGNDNGNDNS